MSAIIGICGDNAAHILTDAASTATKDGTVAAIHTKQVVTRNGVAIGGVGLWLPVVRFARFAEERTANYDELTEVAPALWEEARATLSSDAKAVPCVLLFAGWSTKEGRLDMCFLNSQGEFLIDVGCYAGGPSEECCAFVDPFIQRVGPTPDTFDARDGIEFFETLRRDWPRQFDDGRHPAVGGFITHTKITKDGAETGIIYHWPDRVGRLIDVDAVAGDFPWGLAEADFYRAREAVVRQFSGFDLAKVGHVLAQEMAQEEAAGFPQNAKH